MTEWQPIEDLPPDWQTMAREDVHALARVWADQRQKLEHSQSFRLFLERMLRKIAIETGLIERLYIIDRGVTRILIAQGIDEALIPHGATDKATSQVVALIRDQAAAIERVFDFVGGQRDLSTSFIKQLHQLLTRNQPDTEAVDQFGNIGRVDLLRGEWKKWPNNPTRRNGTQHFYCPPEQVASQMDQLISWHLQHLREGVGAEVEAAWLHHRFTQIHPFQDGNGRVARCLATLVFLKAGWFPLAILDENLDENRSRIGYIAALEAADFGKLNPLIDLFAAAQICVFQESLSLNK